MLNLMKSVLLLVIAVTEKALRADAPSRCIRGGSVAARAARHRQLLHDLDHADSGPESSILAAQL